MIQLCHFFLSTWNHLNGVDYGILYKLSFSVLACLTQKLHNDLYNYIRKCNVKFAWMKHSFNKLLPRFILHFFTYTHHLSISHRIGIQKLKYSSWILKNYLHFDLFPTLALLIPLYFFYFIKKNEHEIIHLWDIKTPKGLGRTEHCSNINRQTVEKITIHILQWIKNV